MRDYTIAILLCCYVFTSSFAQITLHREAFEIGLQKLSLGNDPTHSSYKTIRIDLNQTNKQSEYALITRLDDYYIKNSANSSKKITYSEVSEFTNYASTFELECCGKVVTSFLKVLKQFDALLQKKNWNRCLYLDSYFPRFLQSFYYLNCAMFNSLEVLPQSCAVPDSLFDVSLNSKKSDKRIQIWTRNDTGIKLQIASRELDFQLQQWLKRDFKEGRNSTRHMVNGLSQHLQQVYLLFISLYFNRAS